VAEPAASDVHVLVLVAIQDEDQFLAHAEVQVGDLVLDEAALAVRVAEPAASDVHVLVLVAIQDEDQFLAHAEHGVLLTLFIHLPSSIKSLKINYLDKMPIP
jgi:hypothetical protein